MQTKVCTTCKIEKDITLFDKAKSGKYGVAAECKKCRSDRVKLRRQLNREEVLKKEAAKREKNREAIRNIQRNYVERHKERLLKKRKDDYYAKREENIKYSIEWCKANPEKTRANKLKWKKANPHSSLQYQSKRRKSVARATPKWCDNELDTFLFEEIYHLRDLRTKLTGIKHHVDHIIPLISDVVCGLHCPLNLRVVPSSVNLSKGNKFDIEEFNSAYN